MEKTVIKEEFLKQAKKLSRGCDVLPDGINGLALKLQNSVENNKPLRIKLGMDPTRPDLHLGHSVVMRKLKEFQKLGHKIVLIIGGATAMIGDPSGKSETRPALTKEDVEKNAQTYLSQMNKVLDTSNEEVRNNADWFHSMNLQDLLSLASKITVAQIMTRDDFSKRYQESRPIAVHEFFYPLMQAYDSVVVDSDIELGGSDQRFNVLLGRDIQSAYGKKEPQMVMLLPLLEGTDGVVKMSKTYPQHCISFTDSASNMYGKIMSIPDDLIIRYYELLTDVEDEEIEQIKSRLQVENPRNIKMELALTITKLYHPEEVALNAQNEFINVVQKKQIPDNIKEFEINNEISLISFLVDIGFSSSKSEAKRLIIGGGVKIDGNKISDINYMLDSSSKNTVLQAGKRNFIKFV